MSLSISNSSFFIFSIYALGMLVACSSEKATYQKDESSNQIMSFDSPALNCCKTLEDEIIDLKINLALLQQQINITGKEIQKNREKVLHQNSYIF